MHDIRVDITLLAKGSQKPKSRGGDQHMYYGPTCHARTRGSRLTPSSKMAHQAGIASQVTVALDDRL